HEPIPRCVLVLVQQSCRAGLEVSLTDPPRASLVSSTNNACWKAGSLLLFAVVVSGVLIASGIISGRRLHPHCRRGCLPRGRDRNNIEPSAEDASPVCEWRS
ncbi:unnamed protein product, partial [Hapterophycus canaliculatus]